MGSNTGCLAPLCGLFINTTAYSTFAGSSQQQLHKAVLAGMRHKVWELI